MAGGADLWAELVQRRPAGQNCFGPLRPSGDVLPQAVAKFCRRPKGWICCSPIRSIRPVPASVAATKPAGCWVHPASSARPWACQQAAVAHGLLRP